MNELTLLPFALKYAPGHPRRTALNLEHYTPIGPVEGWRARDDGLLISGQDGSTVLITVLAPDLVRVTCVRGDDRTPSWALTSYAWPGDTVTVTEAADHLALHTSRLEVRVYRNPLVVEFRDRNGRVINRDWRPMGFQQGGEGVVVARGLSLTEHFYGLGEKASGLDHRRGRFSMWTSDHPAYLAGVDPLYQSIPFYIGLDGGQAYGIYFDNSYRTEFDFGRLSQDYVTFSAHGGPLDYYFFGGPDMPGILERYGQLTGFMPLPPRWSLGNQQSRYSYYPQSLVEAVVQTYRDHDLPLDVIHLDIHYMDGYRVFTWHPDRFPDPAGLMQRLRALGVRTIAIVDPGVKYQPTAANKLPVVGDLKLSPKGYPVFDEGVKRGFFQKRPDGTMYIGEVWPGKSVFVDYTREDARQWWGDLHKALTDVGVDGIWNDMNEPADFTDRTGEVMMDILCHDHGANSNHAKNRNVFALLETWATYEGMRRLRPNERPFIVTRAGFAGIQRYASVWTGDNASTWTDLALSIPMFCNMGLSGLAFVGADIGGYLGRCNGELLVRWYEAAFLTPFCRNHEAVDGYDQEPWRFGSVYEDIIRQYLKLRYRLLPYLYTCVEEASRTGMPVVRPLVLQYPDDNNTWTLDDQFMVGPDLLLAPILQAGSDSRRVYLPAGRWYDFWTQAVVEGPRLLRVDAPLEVCPMFVRGGAAIPMGPDLRYTDEKPLDPLTWRVYPDADGQAAGHLYEDDGISWDYQQGKVRRSRLTCAGDQVRVEVAEAGYHPPARTTEIVFPPASGFRDVSMPEPAEGYSVALTR